MTGTRVIGLTGGIGSGKSTVSRLLRQNGIPVVDADALSRGALDIGTDCYQNTVRLFGEACLHTDRTIDRKYVAERIFSDASVRDALNAIIHPYVLERLREATDATDAEWIVWEVPLLFESGFDAYCDRTVTVMCSEAIRIQRICLRDNCTAEQALSRIRAQMSDAERLRRSDDALWNESDEKTLQKAVSMLIERWREELI